MKVLVACEYSGTVREAFRKAGHDAWSCDLLPTDIEGNHYQDDALRVAYNNHWDLMIAHPPCTDIAVSGAAHFKQKIADGRQQAALEFVRALLNAPIDKICLENPVSVISTKIRKPSQIIQPFMFGHLEQKRTCLWLKGLPPLVETNNVYDEMMKLPRSKRERLHYLGPSANRWKLRSTTFSGIAEAMASQWGE
jgi:site-specific DNA-cytosine methylase